MMKVIGDCFYLPAIGRYSLDRVVEKPTVIGFELYSAVCLKYLLIELEKLR